MASCIVDFGLVVLVWMTQLIVYPGFHYYSTEGLVKWHGKYTFNITTIVMPLMLVQLTLHLISLLLDPSWLNWISIFLIVFVWVNTFFYAVPLHKRIADQNAGLKMNIDALIQVNWFRTALWTIVFLLSLITL